MRKTGSKARKITQTSRSHEGQADIASKIATAVTSVVAKKSSLASTSSAYGGTTVNIHVGDIYLIGFDEAIDAEEWGMRETNTEIMGGTSKSEKNARSANEDALANKNRVVARRIDLSKGGVKLVATENSKPAAKNRQSAATKPRAKASKKRRG